MLNDYVGAIMPGKNRICKIADSSDKPDEQDFQYLPELFNSIPETAYLTDSYLYLKKGYVVILLHDLQPKKKHIEWGKINH